MKDDLLKELNEEQVAKAEGVELTEEQLAAVSGGASSSGSGKTCPNCGSKNTVHSPKTKGKSINGILVSYYRCKDCKKVFAVI